MSSCPTDSEEADMQQEAEGFSASRQELGAWKNVDCDALSLAGAHC